MGATLVQGDIDGLQAGWSSLFERDPLATPFLSFAWQQTWLRHWGAGGRPWVLLVSDGERLAGLAPFFLRTRGGLRSLTGMGAGLIDCWDVLAAPEDRPQVLVEVARALSARDSEWDALYLDKLPEESATARVMTAAGLHSHCHTRWASPRIELPGSLDEYLRTLSSGRRWRVRRNLRAIDSGELSIRAVSDPAELARALVHWQALRDAWWSKRHRKIDPQHGSERFLAFVQDAVAAMVPMDLALVREVRHRDELAGVTVDFIDRSSFYYWLAGFRPDLERLRPGHALIAHGIRWSIETGRRYYDFLLGGESYKYDYAPVDRAVLSMTLGNHHLRSRAAVALSSLRRESLARLRRAASRRPADPGVRPYRLRTPVHDAAGR